MKKRNVRWPVSLVKATLFATALLGSVSPSLGGEPIMSYLHINTDPAGKDVLFLRKDPVTAASVGFDEQSTTQFNNMALLYAMASSIPLCFTAKDPNLLIIKTDNIAIGDKLNPEALRKFNIPETLIAMMVETSGWSSGCGGYVFRSGNGRISGAIELADARLDTDLYRDCIAKFVSHAFGIGTARKLPLPGPDGRFKAAYLLNIIQKCDNSHSTISELLSV